MGPVPFTAEQFFGVRLNVFTSIVVGLAAAAYLFWQRGRPREVIDRVLDAGGTALLLRAQALASKDERALVQTMARARSMKCSLRTPKSWNWKHSCGVM